MNELVNPARREFFMWQPRGGEPKRSDGNDKQYPLEGYRLRPPREGAPKSKYQLGILKKPG